MMAFPSLLSPTRNHSLLTCAPRPTTFQLADLMQGLIKSGGLKSRPLRARDIHAYYFCDILAGFLIQFMLVFSPWAFGTTEPWSIWTMNLCGYALGILLLVKSSIRFFKGYCVNESD